MKTKMKEEEPRTEKKLFNPDTHTNTHREQKWMVFSLSLHKMYYTPEILLLNGNVYPETTRSTETHRHNQS